ncbi:MAG: ATP-binding cassette domain-containing protein, partial [Clostridiales bacterium]|nr:ATP-binding cassette domain-containing protein [Clostridiales bacterium]
DIEEINADRDKFLANVSTNVEAELRKIGLKLINVNVTDIRDESGYIEALGKEAAAKAINDAKKSVAEQNRFGEIGKAEADRRVIELLHRVGISDPESRLDQYPYAFSGGMRQRIVLAIALANSPKLIIADEPTTALDVTTQAQVLDLIYEMSRQTRAAVIMVTHDLGV